MERDSINIEVPESLKNAISKLGEAVMGVSKINSTNSAQIKEAWEIIKKEAPEGTVELSKYGWYLGYDSLPKTPVELSRKLKKGKTDEVDKFLCEFYEEELDNIENRIIDWNPNRGTIIKEAFENHRNKRYFSSIALLLTQIDGLCHDEYGEKFFASEKKIIQDEELRRPKIRKSILKEKGDSLNVFLVILDRVRGINVHTDKLSEFPVRLNRHEILHGMDYEYGTQLNSFKIISLLNFINDIVRYKHRS